MSRFDIRINSIRTPQSRTRVTLHIRINSIWTSQKDMRFTSGSTLSGLPQEGTCGMQCYPDQTPSGLPKRTHGASAYPDSLRERHTTLANITSGRPTYPIRICLSGSLTEVSKSCYIILTACHSLRSVACRAKGQRGWQVTSDDPSPAEWKDMNDDKSPPTISVSRLQGDDGPNTTLESSWRAKKSYHH